MMKRERATQVYTHTMPSLECKASLVVVGLAVVFISGCGAAEGPQIETEGAEVSSTGAIPLSLLDEDGVQIVLEHLTIPWDIAFLPGGDFLVTERPGTLLWMGKDRFRQTIAGVHHIGEGGLLGIALHPDFSENQWIYLYMTTEEGEGLRNRVERYRWESGKLTERTEILLSIPGAIYHDGGRIEFGPDKYLYVTTGDATNEDLAQRTDSLAGKILRVNDDGSIPEDNPFGNAVYSYGHRNPQGLAWDATGQLWSTEHGRSGACSGYDELNKIQKGGNYGWPVIQGPETKESMVHPVLHSGANDTWAPGSLEYSNGSLFFTGLRGEAIYEFRISEDTSPLREHFKSEYGRLRTIRLGPDGYFYVLTSNRDGRGGPGTHDDKILKIHPDRIQDTQ